MEGGSSFLSSIFDTSDFFRNPSSLTEAFLAVVLCATMIGRVICWSWRPRWTSLVYLPLRSRLRLLLASAASPSIFSARRIWLAFTAVWAFSDLRAIWPNLGTGVGFTESAEDGEEVENPERYRDAAPEEADSVTEDDLEHLLQLLSTKEGDIEWQNTMERSTPNMAYEAWRHEPKTGPSILRSRTVFEDASPDLVRDFFWNDEFRPKWDPMLALKVSWNALILGLQLSIGSRSDREYIIGKRIWEAGKTLLCNKGKYLDLVLFITTCDMPPLADFDIHLCVGHTGAIGGMLLVGAGRRVARR